MVARSQLFGILATGYILALYATSGVMRDVLNTLKMKVGDVFPLLAVLVCILGLLGCAYWYRVALEELRTGRVLTLLLVLVGYGFALIWLRIPEERIHLLQYGVLAWLVTEALREKLASYRLHLLSVGIVIIAGIGDELVQWVRPNRVGDLRDVGINMVAAVLAQALLAIVLSIPRPVSVER